MLKTTRAINTLITLEQSVLPEFMKRYEAPHNLLNDAQYALCQKRWEAGENYRSYYSKLEELRGKTPYASLLKREARRKSEQAKKNASLFFGELS